MSASLISRRLCGAGVSASVLALALVSLGCYSGLDHTYYIKTYDPAVESANYFRISIHGDTSLSKSKYSVGFFDRDAVERLFGEASVNRRFRETHPDFFDSEADTVAADAAKAARAVEVAPTSRKKEALEELLLHVVALQGRYWFRLQQDLELEHHLGPAMKRAAAGIGAAKVALKGTTPDLDAAARELAFVRAVLEGVRAAVDDDVIVRFFDGAGNEIDVTTKTMVIFVASDASRFSSALEQLAGEEAARQNVLLTILGPKVREAERLEAQVAHSDSRERRTAKELGEALETVKALPAKLEGKPAEEVSKARQEELKTLRKRILEAATAATDRTRVFSSADEIRGFAEALEDAS